MNKKNIVKGNNINWKELVIEFKRIAVETAKDFLKRKLVGHNVKINFLDCEDAHRWKFKVIKVTDITWHQFDANGPELIDENGKHWQTYPDIKGLEIVD